MAVELPKQTYSGKIKEVELGLPGRALKVGAETAYPFYLFEGEMPHKPRIALEVDDMPPVDWAAAVLDPYKDVVSDPVAWARKCVKEYGADLVHLELTSTDPNGENRGAEDAAQIAKKVAESLDVPLAVWGSNNVAKDSEVLRRVAEVCEGKRLAIGPIQAENHKALGAGIIGFGHTAIASTPIDINLAKQLNILLGNLGVPDGQIVIDPTTGGLGYGLEYTYSVMERARMAALTQQDEKLQFPLYCNLGKEVWKVKEAKLSAADAPELGDPARRGILMEAVTAAALLMAGADVLVLRHPESVKLVRSLVSDLLG